MENELIKSFELPKYSEIPNVGLFLEQTVKYVSEVLKPFESFSITGSMVSNYVKKGILDNPVKKQYSRDQIAYVFYIAIAKTVLSLEDIQMMISMQKEYYDCETAYEYFRQELRNVLLYVFETEDELSKLSEDSSVPKKLLRNTIITVAHKIYLDYHFHEIKELKIRNKKNQSPS